MKRWGIVLTALGLAVTAGGVAPTVAAAAPSAAVACEAGWGSLDKALATHSEEPLTNVRTGRHDCYDRMVFDVPGMTTANPAGHRVGYVDKITHVSETPIPVSGGAILAIRIATPVFLPGTTTPAYPVSALAAPLPGVNLTGYETFRDARYAGYYHGETTVGLGVRARLPFRVLTLPDRVVVDVAHTW
ncbi:AMIN-like domain-containing (lipo)protein [Streptomyces paludis]|uniref:AMIN-like domain-containing protein n=1 Tax=Streptomyces paludis TaxID=2282738 RepID=A0A345HWJ1_9ACTN|nr:hypothetical protein [Streptomyces paludis]AXG81065.1 hypothetical protein DVK44_29070 [Streptomyces paludis]